MCRQERKFFRKMQPSWNFFPFLDGKEIVRMVYLVKRKKREKPSRLSDLLITRMHTHTLGRNSFNQKMLSQFASFFHCKEYKGIWVITDHMAPIWLATMNRFISSSYSIHPISISTQYYAYVNQILYGSQEGIPNYTTLQQAC